MTRIVRNTPVLFLPLLLGLGWSAGCGPAEAPPEGVSALFSPLPEFAPAPEDNPTTPERIELGKMLFFEPRLSRSNTVSCNTCHVIGSAGVDHRTVPVGVDGRIGSRNSPTVYNAAFLASQFWDGRIPTLEEQAKGRVQAHVEMDLTPEEAVDRLRETGYGPYFADAFPDAAVAVSFDNMAKAIAAFERTLVTPGSPFDRYLEGDMAALTQEQKDGLTIFQAEGCAGCHNGPLLGGEGYAAFSHVKGAEDTGRQGVTGNPSDAYVFRVAPLRNIALTYPYFHNGSAKTLKEAVSVMAKSELGTTLDEEAQSHLIAFLESLTGEFPQIAYPYLPRRVSETSEETSGAGMDSNPP